MCLRGVRTERRAKGADVGAPLCMQAADVLRADGAAADGVQQQLQMHPVRRHAQLPDVLWLAHCACAHHGCLQLLVRFAIPRPRTLPASSIPLQCSGRCQTKRAEFNCTSLQVQVDKQD